MLLLPILMFCVAASAEKSVDKTASEQLKEDAKKSKGEKKKDDKAKEAKPKEEKPKAEKPKDEKSKSAEIKKEKTREPAEELLLENDEDFQVTTHRTDGSEDFSNSPDRLNVVSWKMKKGSFKYDIDRVASVMSSADLIVLQDIEFNENGETSVNVIANILEKRLGEKVCRGWFKNGVGKRNRFGFIWRDQQIAHVDKNGEMKESCSNRPVVMRTETKDYGIATFFLKSNRRLFVVNSVDLQSLKNPDGEITRLFRPYSDTEWAVVYAGDLKTSAKSSAFKEPKKWNFKSALDGSAPKSGRKGAKRPYDNLWFKNISLISAAPVNLYEHFPELNPAEVDSTLGDIFPIRAEFTFSDREAEAVQTQLISKKKSKGPASTAAPIVLKGPAYPAPVHPKELSSLKEDIESEAQLNEPAKTVSAKTGKKKKKK